MSGGVTKWTTPVARNEVPLVVTVTVTSPATDLAGTTAWYWPPPSSSTDSEDVPAVIFTDWPPTPLPKTSRTKAVAVEVDEPSAPTVLGSSERVMDVGVPA